MQIVHKTIACVFYIDSPSGAIVISADSDEEEGRSDGLFSLTRMHVWIITNMPFDWIILFSAFGYWKHNSQWWINCFN